MMARQSIAAILADRASAAPDEVLVVDGDGELTAGGLDAAAARLAVALRDRGVRTDDLVAVSLANGRDFVIACAAVWKAGATAHPIPTTLTDDERAAVEDVSHPTAAIGARPVREGIAWFETVDAPDTAVVLPDRAAASWKAVTTSGSTGQPKVVLAAAPAVFDPTGEAAPFLPRRAIQLVAGPMTHSATFTYAFRGLLTGHRLIVLPRFDEQRWVEAVQRHSVTWALVVPTMMHRLLRLPATERRPSRIRSLESVLHLGAPCAPELKREFMTWVGAQRVVEVYAGSESNGLTMIRGDEWLQRPGSVGRPIGGTQVEIRDDAGAAVGCGDLGTVWMRRGEQPSYSYLGSTASRRDDRGWDTLGDLGRVDSDGYLYLLDRADDVINRGGDKIYPIEIERVLEQHPSVRSAVAFGVPDPALGQQVRAVADTAGADVAAGELEQWARARLGSRAPVAIRIVDSPVRNDAGKTSRRRWAAAPSSRGPGSG